MKVKILLAVALCLSGQVSAQDSSNVRTVGYYDTPGYTYGVKVAGNYAYVADGSTSSGLLIIDVSNPASPFLVGSYPGGYTKLSLSGNYTYVTNDTFGLRIVNISDPVNPTLAGSCGPPFMTWMEDAVAVSGNYAYAGNYGDMAHFSICGLRNYNISNPASPSTLNFSQGVYVDDMVVSAGYLYAAGSYYYDYNMHDGLMIINPVTLSLVGFYNASGGSRVAVSGSYAYMSVGTTLQIINVSDHTSPSLAGTYNLPGSAFDVAVSGTFAYVASDISGLRILDISNPASPTEVGYYNTPGKARGLTVAGDYVYVGDYTSGLRIYESYGPAGVTVDQTQNANFKVQGFKLRVYGNTMEYSVPQSGNVSLKAYNLLGQEVNTLVRGNKTAGSYKINWNGRDDSGRRVSSGVYLVRLEANGQAATAKMVVLR